MFARTVSVAIIVAILFGAFWFLLVTPFIAELNQALSHSHQIR